MNKLIDKVLSMRITVISIFTVLGIVCMMLFTITPVNYNMMDYLPKDANSTKALELMEEEFSIPMPNLDVMVEDVSLVEALQTKDIILSSEYVRDVIWLDDVTDIKIPMEFLPSELLESYYKDNSALFMVAVQDGYEKDSIASIRENLGEIDVKFSGTAAIQAQSQELAISEGARAGILIVPILIIILILFTKSYIEPLLYLITLGVAIMINLGTGFFFGGVSFVTLAAAPLLQLAVSIDYAVFLSHSYEGYRREYVPKEAIKLALKSSNKSILASMLTTMFGFMALLFMRFTIGFDMGVSLVKGVLLSYICVMVLLPVLLVSADEWIKKTKHRSFLPSFKGIGHVIVKCSIPLAFIIIV